MKKKMRKTDLKKAVRERSEVVQVSNNGLLTLENVSFEYQLKGSVFAALNNINFTVQKGEFIAIVGASGSGKSTLMNLIGLMAHPTHGNVFIDGVPVGQLQADELARLRNEKIGFIFQQFHLLPNLNVLDNVLLPAEYAESNKISRPEYQNSAYFLLQKFGLLEQMTKRPAALSGGQKQRVAICRGLLCNPDLILADEPTGALDSKNSKLVLDILEELNNQGKTIIVITHDPAVASRARRVLKIHDGIIVSDEHMNKMSVPEPAPPAENSANGHDKILQHKFSWMDSLLKTIQLSIRSMITQKVRSALTIFGLMVGVSSIIIMLTLTGEAKNAFKSFFDTKGGNQGWIFSDGRAADRGGSSRWRGWHAIHDVSKLNASFSKYGRIDSSIRDNSCFVKSVTRVATTDLDGMNSLAEVGDEELTLKSGRFFKPNEMQNAAEGKVALLGSDIAEKLFPPTDPGFSKRDNYPLGEILFVKGCRFESSLKVIGILQPRDAFLNSTLNSAVTVPTTTLLGNGLSPYSGQIVVTPNTGVNPTWFTESVKNYVALQTQNKIPLRSFVPEQQIKKINLMLTILSGLTLIVGGLCTIIGGIGVMNIMLVNISERIKEIGIRKAVGASSIRIRNQFLFESVVLCSISGIVGVFIGLLVSNFIMLTAAHYFSRYLNFHLTWNLEAVILGLTTSLAAGVTFGIVPARRAGTMNIVDALRQE